MANAQTVFMRYALVLGLTSAGMAVLLMRSWFGPAQAFAAWLGAAFLLRLLLTAGVVVVWLRDVWRTRPPQALLESVLPERHQDTYRTLGFSWCVVTAALIGSATFHYAHDAASWADRAVWGLCVLCGQYSVWAAADIIAEMAFHPRSRGDEQAGVTKGAQE